MNDPGSLVIPIPLHRRRYNKSQAGLSRAQRKKNVAGIFSVPHKYRDILSGRSLILVDDVMASGPSKGLAVARVL
jgi:predicted amidophosphoribosyltransferase